MHEIQPGRFDVALGRCSLADMLLLLLKNENKLCLRCSPPIFSCARPMGHCWTKSCNGNDYDKDILSELAGGSVHLVNTMEKWTEMTSRAKDDHKMVAVNFSATWSDPCRCIASVYRELADKYSSILFLTVDVDELVELSTSWDVKATPTFYFLRDGRQIDKLVGADKLELKKKLLALASSNP